MRWIVGLLLLVSLGRALADETPVSNETLEEPAVVNAYDRAIIRFNTDIKNFSSWETFKAEVLSRVNLGTVGRCYESTGGAMNPVKTTTVKFQTIENNGWRKTSGMGWRKHEKDRTFVEYRFNKKRRLLLRIEGVRPRFFFAYTKRICEFPV